MCKGDPNPVYKQTRAKPGKAKKKKAAKSVKRGRDDADNETDGSEAPKRKKPRRTADQMLLDENTARNLSA